MTPSNRVAFSSTDLVVVIGLFIVLLTFFFPLIQLIREETRRLVCLDRVATMGGNSLGYEALNEQLPFYIGPSNFTGPTVQYTYCVTQLLPFYGRDDLVEAIDQAAFDPAPVPLSSYGYFTLQTWLLGVDALRPGIAAVIGVEAQIPEVRCPSDIDFDRNVFMLTRPPESDFHFPAPSLFQNEDRVAHTNYVANVGSVPVLPPGPAGFEGAFGPIRSRESDSIDEIADGAANVVMFGESVGINDELAGFAIRARHGMAVGGLAMGRADKIGGFVELFGDLSFSTDVQFGSAHPRYVNIVRCDGSTQSMSRNVDPEFFGQICASADGLPIKP